MTFTRRSLLYAVPAVLIAAALLWYAFAPPPAGVDVVAVTRGKLEVTVNEDGKTRIKERHMSFQRPWPANFCGSICTPATRCRPAKPCWP